jgi:hypothetical protein
MRTITLFAACLLLFTFGKAQSSSDIPDHVEDHLSKNHPKADEVEWDVEEDGFYEAEFDVDGVEWEIIYDLEGNHHSTEVEIAYSELPSTVRTKLETSFKDYTVLETDEVDRADGSELFEVELENESTVLEIFFDETGRITERDVFPKDPDDYE